jgi:hypothetical protein
MSTAIVTEAEKITVKWSSFENWDSLRKEIMAENPGMPEKEADALASKDQDYHEQCWEDMLEDLQNQLETFNPSGHWYVKGHDMGWQRKSGHKTFRCDRAIDFLCKVTPNTSDYSFDLTVESDHLSMTIWHHDAPTGEGRTICKAVECNECGELPCPICHACLSE